MRQHQITSLNEHGITPRYAMGGTVEYAVIYDASSPCDDYWDEDQEYTEACGDVALFINGEPVFVSLTTA